MYCMYFGLTHPSLDLVGKFFCLEIVEILTTSFSKSQCLGSFWKRKCRWSTHAHYTNSFFDSDFRRLVCTNILVIKKNPTYIPFRHTNTYLDIFCNKYKTFKEMWCLRLALKLHNRCSITVMLKENDRLSTLKLPIARLLLLLVVFFWWPARQKTITLDRIVGLLLKGMLTVSIFYSPIKMIWFVVCVCLGGGRVLLDGSSMYVDR